MRKSWSIQDDNYLRENCKRLSVQELAAGFNRTEKAIRRRMEKLEIGVGRYHSWTPEEISTLKINMELPTREVMKLFPELNRKQILSKIYAIKCEKIRENLRANLEVKSQENMAITH